MNQFIGPVKRLFRDSCDFC